MDARAEEERYDGRAKQGAPIAGVDMRIVDEDGRSVAPGEVGEIVSFSRPLGMIGYWRNEHATAEAFDAEARTGLDHIGLKVPTRDSLEAWASKLDGLGIAHSGIRDITDPVPFSTLVFRDPDNIQLEFIYAP